MDGVKIRLLRADEIECRVSTINEKGLSLLLFKDARVDQKILDEAFTPFGWKRSHQTINGNLYCTVEIWDAEKGQWVSKQDVGTMSYSEKEKGQASDSFKRACFNWGIGRELYTAPFIWVPAAKVDIQKNSEGKHCTKERFSVAAIGYDEGRAISHLRITNSANQVVYTMGKAAATAQGAEPGPDTSQMEALRKELERTGVPIGAVLERYRLTSTEQMTQGIYKQAMNDLKKSRSRKAA